MRRAAVAVVLAGPTLALTLAACSGGDRPALATSTTTAATVAGPTTTVARTEGGSGAKPTACSLVTMDDARGVLGTSLQGGDGAQGTADTNTICSYHTADRLLLVRVSPQTGERDHTNFPFGQPEPVPDLADDAKFARGEGETFSALSLLRGPVGLTVLYRGPGDHLDICTAVARTALARL